MTYLELKEDNARNALMYEGVVERFVEREICPCQLGIEVDCENQHDCESCWEGALESLGGI